MKLTSNIEKIVRGEIKSEADVRHFLSEVAILIEIEKLGNYPTIKFYRDWTQHSKKDNIKDLYCYFEEIERLLNSVPMITIIRKELSQHIEKLTSFENLKMELKNLLKNFNIDYSFIDSDKKWNGFCDCLLQLIMRKPIYFKGLKTSFERHRLSKAPISRKIIMFLIDYPDPKFLPAYIPGAIYWALFINTSEVPISNVVKLPSSYQPIIDTRTNTAIYILPKKKNIFETLVNLLRRHPTRNKHIPQQKRF